MDDGLLEGVLFVDGGLVIFMSVLRVFVIFLSWLLVIFLLKIFVLFVLFLVDLRLLVVIFFNIFWIVFDGWILMMFFGFMFLIEIVNVGVDRFFVVLIVM